MSMKQQYTKNHMVRLSEDSDKKLRRKTNKLNIRPAVHIRNLVEKDLEAVDK